MSAMASLVTRVTIVYSTVCSGADQSQHQSSASLTFVRGIHQWPANAPLKGPVKRKILPFDDVIMTYNFRKMPFICRLWIKVDKALQPLISSHGYAMLHNSSMWIIVSPALIRKAGLFINVQMSLYVKVYMYIMLLLWRTKIKYRILFSLGTHGAFLACCC